ncbi:MAG: nitroreductase/quinone reductase family protein [Chloroflexota bacterium]
MREFINKLSNIFMKPLLRSPLHVLVSKHYLLITFTGRKSGKIYSTPVEYMRDGDRVTFFTQRERSWWKNLQDDAPLTLRVSGQDYPTRAQVIVDEEAIRATFKRMHAKIKQAPDFAAQTIMVQIALSADYVPLRS